MKWLLDVILRLLNKVVLLSTFLSQRNYDQLIIHHQVFFYVIGIINFITVILVEILPYHQAKLQVNTTPSMLRAVVNHFDQTF